MIVGTVGSAEANKQLVHRMVDEVVNQRNADALDESPRASSPTGSALDHPFRAAFPDFTMEIVDLIAENEVVVGHFKCFGAHIGDWLGVPPTGGRLRASTRSNLRVKDGKLASAIGVEDNLSRMSQLGIRPTRAKSSRAAPVLRCAKTISHVGESASVRPWKRP